MYITQLSPAAPDAQGDATGSKSVLMFLASVNQLWLCWVPIGSAPASGCSISLRGWWVDIPGVCFPWHSREAQDGTLKPRKNTREGPSPALVHKPPKLGRQDLKYTQGKVTRKMTED